MEGLEKEIAALKGRLNMGGSDGAMVGDQRDLLNGGRSKKVTFTN